MAGFVMPILSGLAGLFGGGQQQKQQTTQNTNSTTNTSGNQSSTTTPNLSPLQQALIQMFTQGSADLFQQSQNLSPYTQQGLQTIGAQGNANRQTIANTIASRGLSYSPAATTALTGNTINAGNQQSQFLAGIPLLQRQLQQQSIDELMKSFGIIPTGQTSSGSTSGTSNTTGTMTGTQTQSGNPMGGLFGGVGAALPLAFPGLFGGGPKLNNQLPNGQSYNMQPDA